jgi:hypothetical protein
VHIDAPNPNFIESWKKLVEKYPEYIGGYAIFESDEKVIITDLTKDHISDHCIFNNGDKI